MPNVSPWSGRRRAQAQDGSGTAPLLADTCEIAPLRKRTAPYARRSHHEPGQSQPGEAPGPSKTALELRFREEYLGLRGGAIFKRNTSSLKERNAKSQKARAALERETVRQEWMQRLRPLAHRQ